jgi:hypothetical protein
MVLVKKNGPGNGGFQEIGMIAAVPGTNYSDIKRAAAEKVSRWVVSPNEGRFAAGVEATSRLV